MQEGGSGTIAACFQSTSVGNTNSLTPVFRNDIKWLWMNATSTVQLPNNNINSNVWYNGYILRAANVIPSYSGNYCCVIGDTETCTVNAITQLINSFRLSNIARQLGMYTYMIIIDFTVHTGNLQKLHILN